MVILIKNILLKMILVLLIVSSILSIVLILDDILIIGLVWLVFYLPVFLSTRS